MGLGSFGGFCLAEVLEAVDGGMVSDLFDERELDVVLGLGAVHESGDGAVGAGSVGARGFDSTL
jgi:hypothetical protein